MLVRCINALNYSKITENKVYEVHEENSRGYFIINDQGCKRGYFKWRFKIVKKETDTNIIHNSTVDFGVLVI